MKLEKLKDFNQDELKQFLLDESVHIYEHHSYLRPLAPAEIQAKINELADAMIKKKSIEVELEQVKSQYNVHTEPLKRIITECLAAIGKKAVPYEGKVYDIADYELQTMFTVDEYGIILAKRPLSLEERQFRLSAIQ